LERSSGVDDLEDVVAREAGDVDTAGRIYRDAVGAVQADRKYKPPPY